MNKNVKCSKIDILISIIGICIIIIWLFLCISPKILGISSFIILLFIIPLLFMGGLNTINEENNGKSGYYAEYGTSYGANADKHKKYLEEKIANEIMK